MSEKSISINCGGVSATILTLAFFIAKVMKLIDWSWWWVFCPLWGPAAIILFIFLVILLLIGAAWLVTERPWR